MAAKQGLVTLSPDQLNDTDRALLDLLREGRITPRYAADELGMSRPYASERLKRLLEHEHVSRLASGLYQVENDPRGVGTDDVDAEAAREAFRELLDARDRVDQEAIDEALDELAEALGVDEDG